MKRIACMHLTAADGTSPIEDRELQIVECCGQFSPIVGFEPTDRRSVLLDISGLAHLFGGERALGIRVARHFRGLGLTLRAAFATFEGCGSAMHHDSKVWIAPLLQLDELV